MLIQRISLETSLMIVVEDLHWSDPLTLAYLTELVGSSSNHPLILVMTSRLVGDPLEKMRQYATGNMTLTILDLGPLKEVESYEFADKFLIRHEFIKRLTDRYRKEGIEIPFPIRTVYLKKEE